MFFFSYGLSEGVFFKDSFFSSSSSGAEGGGGGVILGMEEN